MNIDNSKDISKLICIIHGPRHKSDECKVLGDFGSKYSKIREDRGHDTTTNKKLAYIKRIMRLFRMQWMISSYKRTRN